MAMKVFAGETPITTRHTVHLASNPLIFLFLSCLLAGCLGTPQIPPSQETVTLKFAWWSNGEVKDASFKSWIQSFERTHPNIRVNATFSDWTTYWDAVPNYLSSKDPYDLIGQCTCMIAPFFASDQFVDLQALPGFQEATRNLNPGPFASVKWNNKQLGLPLGQADIVVGYNKALFAQAGIAPPDPLQPMTFDRFLNLAKALTITGPDGQVTQYGFHNANRFEFMLQGLTVMHGGTLFDRYIDPHKYTINNDAGIAALSDWKELSKYMPPITQPEDTPWTTGDLPALQTGKVAMATIGPWDFAPMMVDEQANKFSYGIFPVWTGNDGSHLARNNTNALGIPKVSKHQEAAWEFLQWAIQTPAQVAFSSFSDVPVDRAAVAQLDHIIYPPSYLPTLMYEVTKFQPTAMSAYSGDLTSVYEDITTRLQAGELTPDQAASELEKQGNAILSKK